MIKIVDGHLARQQNQIGKVRPVHKTACLTTFLFAILIGLHVISGSCILKLTGQKFTSFLWCYFLSMPSFLLWLKTCQTSTPQKSLTKILSLRERSIKAAEKDRSTTVVASICLTGATVVGSVNATEFWQRQTWPPSFLLLLCCKMDLVVPQYSTLFTLAAK